MKCEREFIGKKTFRRRGKDLGDIRKEKRIRKAILIGVRG